MKWPLITITCTPVVPVTNPLAYRHAQRTVGVATAPSTCVLLLDASGSMAGRKFTEAKDAAAGFWHEARRGGQAVAIIPFGSAPSPLVPFGASPAQTAAALAELQLMGSTDMAAALALARQFLDGATAPRSIVVVTDGMPNDPNATLEEAAALKASGVDIHAVGIPVADAAFLTRLSGSASRTTPLKSETELKATLLIVAQRLLLPPKTQP